MKRPRVTIAVFVALLVLELAAVVGAGISSATAAPPSSAPIAGSAVTDAGPLPASVAAAALDEAGPMPLRLSVIETRLETIADVGRWAAGIIGALVVMLFSLFAWMLRTARGDILTAIADVREEARQAEEAAQRAMPRMECAQLMGAVDRRLDGLNRTPAQGRAL